MATADHGERVGAGKISCAWDFANGFLACIDQICVFGSFERIWADAQHPVFALQDYFHAFWDVVGYQRRHTDAEIYVVAVT